MGKKTENKDGVLIVKPSDDYKKANALISAKYRSTLLENKILTLSLSKADKMVAEEVEINGEKTKVFTSTLHSSELIDALQVSQKNLPTQLKAAYLKMQSRQIGIENEHGEFAYRNLFIGADYKSGEFKLYYNPLLGSYYREISSNYTKLSVSQMMQFSSVHSFRLYELLKKECYIEKGQRDKATNKIRYIITYSLAELKLALGIINSNSEAVRNVLNKSGTSPDYEMAVKVAPEGGFSRWSDLKRRCIDPAIEEINEITKLVVSYELKKSGQGGKVHALEFHVEECLDNSTEEKAVEILPKKELSEDEKNDFIFDLKDILSKYPLKSADLRTIAETSNYNMDSCKKAVEVLNNTTSKVENIVAFLIKAIKEEWSSPIKKAPNREFQQREYDYDELEKVFVKNL